MAFRNVSCLAMRRLKHRNVHLLASIVSNGRFSNPVSFQGKHNNSLFRPNFVLNCYSSSSASTTAAVAVNSAVQKLNTSLFNLMKHYENLIGLSEVKIAQQRVIEAERDFTKTQELRREKQDEIRDVQTRLKEIHVELDKTSRGEDKYLNLLTQEHAIIKREKQLMDEFKRLERSERDCFTTLSNRLRDSHEKEREQAEKTKYASIIGSILCGVIGVIGGTILNKLRLQDIKQIVQDSTEPGRFQALIAQLSSEIEKQQQHIRMFINDLNAILNKSPTLEPSLNVAAVSEAVDQAAEPAARSDAILRALKEQDDKLTLEMNEIKKLIATEHGYSVGEDGTTVVYVGPELKSMLDETEKNLEWKIKINSLVNVVVVYATLAITLPIVYAMLRGS